MTHLYQAEEASSQIVEGNLEFRRKNPLAFSKLTDKLSHIESGLSGIRTEALRSAKIRKHTVDLVYACVTEAQENVYKQRQTVLMNIILFATFENSCRVITCLNIFHLTSIKNPIHYVGLMQSNSFYSH